MAAVERRRTLWPRSLPRFLAGRSVASRPGACLEFRTTSLQVLRRGEPEVPGRIRTWGFVSPRVAQRCVRRASHLRNAERRRAAVPGGGNVRGGQFGLRREYRRSSAPRWSDAPVPTAEFVISTGDQLGPPEPVPGSRIHKFRREQRIAIRLGGVKRRDR